jgi:hypothetical protein
MHAASWAGALSECRREAIGRWQAVTSLVVSGRTATANDVIPTRIGPEPGCDREPSDRPRARQLLDKEARRPFGVRSSRGHLQESRRSATISTCASAMGCHGGRRKARSLRCRSAGEVAQRLRGPRVDDLDQLSDFFMIALRRPRKSQSRREKKRAPYLRSLVCESREQEATLISEGLLRNLMGSDMYDRSDFTVAFAKGPAWTRRKRVCGDQISEPGNDRSAAPPDRYNGASHSRHT